MTAATSFSAVHRPRIATRAIEVRRMVESWHRQGRTIGLVPTMGALHAGHLSLIDASIAECDSTVVTIFVNPTQFEHTDDLDLYPREFEHDITLLRDRGCELVFAPSVDEMYPAGHETYVEVSATAAPLEGAKRPGHFRGVATIVLKLFQIAPAHRAYFGQKDYQQTLVVKRMVEDFNLPVQIRVCPTVREPDGLATSSRNSRLTADERRRALALSQSLNLAAEMAHRGERDPAVIRQRMQSHIEAAGGIDLEYVAIVADETVTPARWLDGPAVALVAARIGSTRLIDNRRIVVADS